MKKRIFTLLLALAVVFGLKAQNTNITNLMSESEYNTTFPNKAALYSYANFKTAISEMADYTVTIKQKAGVSGYLTTVTRKGTGASYDVVTVSPAWHASSVTATTITVDFTDFINRSDQTNNKRELAAFLANVTKETTGGWKPVGSGIDGDHAKWGLHWTEEQNPTSAYTSNGDPNYLPVAGQTYIGRGPIQISWNYNYGKASHFLFNDKTVLLNNPESVATNGVLSFKTAIWFWMSPQCPKPSCHQVMHNVWVRGDNDYTIAKMNENGFAHTNNIINGGLECRSGSAAGYTEKVQLRSDLYLHYLGQLGLSSGDIALENTGDYTTTCYDNSSAAMTDYVGCNVDESDDENSSTCTKPNLGSSQTICGSNVTLSAGVTLGADESIQWYKNNIELDGASTATYSASVEGTYKAVISSLDCVESDEVSIIQGGTLEATAENDGNFCASSAPANVNITVSGGGFYKLFDAENDGNLVASGTSFTLDNNDVSIGQSKTFYIEEASVSESATLGLSSRPANDVDFLAYQYQDVSVSLHYTSFRTIFTAYTGLTLESVDFETANLGNGSAASLIVEVYTLGGATLVNSKTFDLQNTDWELWDREMFTANLGFDLSAGQYELSITPSNISVWISQYDAENSSKTFDFASWNEPGLASIDSTIDPLNRGWGTYTHLNWGNYNWKFSTGLGGSGGPASSCGRTPVTITHDCTTGSRDINAASVSLFPNPAYNYVNINFNNFNTTSAVVEVLNSVGQSVLTQNLNNVSGNVAQINTKELDAGLYFIKVTVGEKSYTSNVVISK
jgi:hypothetical protein|tara:strand:- start:184 stop:2562 length:2379 start_codon:yes stop_codon:yes gene_type:complete